MRRIVTGVVVLLVAAVLAGFAATSTNGSTGGSSGGSETRDEGSQAMPDDRPDVVMILMDDFSTELLATMPNAQKMVRDGASYRNAFVVDSRCCPSRAALLTGQMPHQTGVLLNTPNSATDPIGGYEGFVAHDNERKQFSVALQDSGYHTGFVGKFLNGYGGEQKGETGPDGSPVPPPTVPGWSEWNAISGSGYKGWGFTTTYLDDDGEMQLVDHPVPDRSLPDEVIDRDYATNVASDLALDFLDGRTDDPTPYFLEVATYGPHSGIGKAYPNSPAFPPAMADHAPKGQPTGGNCGPRGCRSLTLRDLVGYDDPRGDNKPTYLRSGGRTAPAPAWRTNKITLSAREALRAYRDRARMAASIDRLIARVRAAAGPDTYVVLTSDNGYHLGQHQLNGGKGTPYDSDTRVPLVVVGPDVVPGVRRQFVSNIDLAPTFEDLAGLEPQTFHAGRSFAATLSDPTADGGHYAAFEHTYSSTVPGEVDADVKVGSALDVVPSYIAIRGRQGLLARFDLALGKRTDYAYELYRYDVPYEDRNVFAQDHDKHYAKQLMYRLRVLDGCRPVDCQRATQ